MAGLINTLGKLFTRKNIQTAPPRSASTTTKKLANTINTNESDTLASSDDDFYLQLLPSGKQGALSLPQKLTIQVVEEHLLDKTGRSKAIPRLPSIIPKLIRSLKDPKASSKDYVEIIRKDPSMSAGVLKLANSVYFNPSSGNVTNIEIAVVKLGIDGLRSVLSTVVMQPVIQRKTPYFNEFGQRLWQHSLATAVVCELLAKTRGIDLYKAYLLGLSHNIGKITLFSEMCQQLKSLPGEDKPDRSAFVPLLQKRSDLLSYEIAQDWQLPDEIISALKQQASLTQSTNLGPFSRLLRDGKNISKSYLAYKLGLQKKIPEAVFVEYKLPTNLFDLLDNLNIKA